MQRADMTTAIIANFFLIAIAVVFAFALQVSAIDSSPSGQTGRITFPISELGNCESPAACRVYCEDPTHRDACLAFAQSHGLKPNTATTSAILLADAKATLGCDSAQSCHDFCEQPGNKDTCLAFAQKHGLTTTSLISPNQVSILAKAKTYLGCDSVAACKLFCSQDANKQKCSDFSRMVGLRGGEKISGPGGCNSIDSCKLYCSDPAHQQQCQNFLKNKFGSTSTPSGYPKTSGPGGCNSVDSCKAYCQSHPDQCANFAPWQNYQNNNPPPQTPAGSITVGPDRCSLTPGYHWTGTQCVPNTTDSGVTITPTPPSTTR